MPPALYLPASQARQSGELSSLRIPAGHGPVGSALGLIDGLAVGAVVGLVLGLPDGATVGLAEGLALGAALGLLDGRPLGLTVGLAIGASLGLALGLALGASVLSLGDVEGTHDGEAVGTGVTRGEEG